jgi:hypothetical protein
MTHIFLLVSGIFTIFVNRNLIGYGQRIVETDMIRV